MLDANSIIATIKAAMSSSQGAQSELSGEFVTGMSGMNLSGPDAASSVMNSTTSGCKDMMAQMEKTFSSLQSDMASHQKMQQQEQPSGFNIPKGDLRDTVARGFPQEASSFLSGKKTL